MRSIAHIPSWLSRNEKTGRALPCSAGFAIGSPRGMGDPHDISPRGSWHLSGTNMRAGTGHRKMTWRGGPQAVPHGGATSKNGEGRVLPFGLAPGLKKLRISY